MKVLLIAYYYPPSTSVGASRAFGFAKSLSDAGHEVTILTHNFPVTETHLAKERLNIVRIENPLLSFLNSRLSYLKESKSTCYSSERASIGNRIKFAINTFRKKRGILFLGRMPDVADCWIHSAKRWIKTQEKWDCTIATYAPYANLLLGNYIKSSQMTRNYIVDFRDPWINHHLFKGLPFLSLIESNLFSKTLNLCDTVTTATPGLAKSIGEETDKKVTSIINGFSYVDSKPVSLPFDIEDPNILMIVHTGSVYLHKQSLDPFFKALTEANEETDKIIRVVFAGNEQEAIIKTAHALGLEKEIIHLGEIDKNQSTFLIEKANLCLCFDINDATFNGIIPVKLLEYLGYSKPILFCAKTQDSDASSLLKSCQDILYSDYKQSSIHLCIKTALQKYLHASFAKNIQYSQDSQNQILLSLVDNRNS